MLAIFALIGLAAGVLAGLFGIGGGILIVPALVFFGRLPIITAVGTSLGALLLPVGALGGWQYYRLGNLDVRAAALVALGLFLGTPLGARVALAQSQTVLQRAFVVSWWWWRSGCGSRPAEVAMTLRWSWAATLGASLACNPGATAPAIGANIVNVQGQSIGRAMVSQAKGGSG